MKENINISKRKVLKSIGGIAGISFTGCMRSNTIDSNKANENTAQLDPLRIGIIVPKTGLYSSLGSRILDASMMAIDKHGKIFGKIPDVFVRDSQTKKTKAITAANELIKNKNIDVLIGGINTPINNAIAKIADKNRIPFLYPAGGSVFMSGIKENPHPFMFFSNSNSIDTSRGLDYIARKYGSNFYFIASDYKYGNDSVYYAKQYLKNKIDDFASVGESFLSQGATDYTSAIANAKSVDPDVVHMTVPGVFAPAQKQAVQAGLTDTAHIHWAYASRPMGLSARKFTEGVTSFTHSPLNSPRINTWAKRFQKEKGYWPGLSTAAAYNGTDMFLAGIKKAGSKDGLEIVKQLEHLKYKDSILGQNTYFRKFNHHIRYSAYIVEWTRSKKYNGGYWKGINKIPIDVIEEASIPIEKTANYPKSREIKTEN